MQFFSYCVNISTPACFCGFRKILEVELTRHYDTYSTDTNLTLVLCHLETDQVYFFLNSEPQCSTIDVAFCCDAITLHHNNLRDSHGIESMLVFWFFNEGHAAADKDTLSRLDFSWRQMKGGTGGTSTAACVDHRLAAALHCSCPSFLLLFVTLVFWPCTPKPAAWVIPDFLWHSSELSRGLD